MMEKKGGYDISSDDPNQQKVFVLAGYNSQVEVKTDLVHKITSLGGKVLESPSWPPGDQVTHVIAANFGHYLEKVMAGLVSGCWVVTRRYVDTSYNKGHWANTKAFVCDDVVLKHRNRRKEFGAIFSDLRVVFILRNQVQSRVYSRIVKAGGGAVLHHTTLKMLIEDVNDVGDINLVVIDDTNHPEWDEWSKIVQQKRLSGKWKDLRHVQYKYLFSCITQCDRVSANQFMIVQSEKDLEMKKRDHHEINSNGSAKRFKRDPLIVDLESESDDDIEVLEQKLMSRRSVLKRVYLERSAPKEVFDIDDSDEDEDSNHSVTSANHQSGISLGLQQAVSASLQPQRRSRHNKVVTGSTTEDNSEDEIEVVLTKPGESRKSMNGTGKVSLFQSRLKQLQDNDDDEVASVSSQDNDDTESHPETERSPSPDLPVHVDPVPIPDPVKPVPSLDSKETKKLMNNILDCILERQSITGECLNTSWVTFRTVKYDRHNESKTSERTVFVDSSVREEFYQKYLEKSPDDNSSMVNQLNQISNILSSLKFLQNYTNHSVHPTSAIINSLMVDCILIQGSEVIIDQAQDYLDITLYRLLSCVSSNMMDRSKYMSTVLSSCRQGKNIQFENFDLENKQDTNQCSVFCQTLLKNLCKEITAGSEALFHILVKICEKDIQIVWRQQKNSSGTNLPLLYYLLGDGTVKILQIIKKYICQLYTNNICGKHPRLLTSVRKLISLSGILLSYLDSVNKQSYINCGAKLELANVLAQSLHQWNKTHSDDGDRIRIELMLLQPQWLSMLVSRQLLKLTASGSLPQKLTSLTELTSAMKDLTLETSGGLACYESLLYRTMSSCHTHTLVRTLWSRQTGPGPGQVFTMMNRLDKFIIKSKDKEEEEKKVVKFRSAVTHKLPPIVDDVQCIANYVNGYQQNSCTNSSIKALLFKMSDPSNY